MSVKLNPALREFWDTPADLKILKGGRASSKTHDAAGRAVQIARHYTTKFLCIRQYQARIADSVYTILIDKIEAGGWESEFHITQSGIIHKKTGSSFHFYGMALNTREIKGFEGADVCWIEEGEGLTQEQWKIIDPTLRKNGAECWIIYNPRLVSDFIESSPLFKHDPENGVIVRLINYNENPFLSDTMRRKIERARKIMDPDDFEHIYLGEPLTDDDSVIIKLSWINAAIGAHLALPELDWYQGGNRFGGFDVADSGADKCAYVERCGRVFDYLDEWKAREDELYKSSARVYSRASGVGADVTYDSIGVGAGAGSNFNVMIEETGIEICHNGFNAGGKVIDPDELIDPDDENSKTNKEHYSNIKAQAWWGVAKRFMNTYNAIHNGMEFNPDELISIDPDIKNLEKLKTELSTPRRTFDKGGRVKVESKEDLAKREVPSPNMADAFIMADAPKVIEYAGFFDMY